MNGAGTSDQITGGDSNTTIYGYAGDDTLSGGGGNDVLVGGPGKDRLVGGAGSDTASYIDANKGVVASLASPSKNKNDASGDTYSSIENLQGSNFADTLYGNGLKNTIDGGAGNDALFGGRGNDVLRGGAGKDKLYGEVGADILFGGAGADHFMFRSIKDSRAAASGRDTISDFSAGQGDKINLSAIDADTKSAGNQAFKFIGLAEFSEKAGQLNYEKTKSGVIVYGDVNGDGKADFSIFVDDVSALKSGNFVL